MSGGDSCLRLVVVASDPGTRSALARVLGAAGHRIVGAVGGVEDAVSICSGGSVDLVVIELARDAGREAEASVALGVPVVYAASGVDPPSPPPDPTRH